MAIRDDEGAIAADHVDFAFQPADQFLAHGAVTRSDDEKMPAFFAEQLDHLYVFRRNEADALLRVEESAVEVGNEQGIQGKSHLRSWLLTLSL